VCTRALLSCPSARVQSSRHPRVCPLRATCASRRLVTVATTLLPGFSCPSAFEVSGSDSTDTAHAASAVAGLSAPGYAAPAGFLNLLTPCSTTTRPALFHAGDTLGLFTFRGFPPPVAARTSRFELPPVPFARDLFLSVAARALGISASGGSVVVCAVLPARTARSSPGVPHGSLDTAPLRGTMSDLPTRG